MAIHGDLLSEAWMDPGNPGNPETYSKAVYQIFVDLITLICP